MLPLCRFYRYLIYRLYHFRDDTPIINTILTLAIVHCFQILTLLLLVNELTQYKLWFDIPPYSERIKLFPYIIIWILLHYILFYNKEKWQSFDSEFKNENSKQRRIGFTLTLTYLIGSIVLFFVILGAFIFIGK